MTDLVIASEVCPQAGVFLGTNFRFWVRKKKAGLGWRSAFFGQKNKGLLLSVYLPEHLGDGGLELPVFAAE